MTSRPDPPEVAELAAALHLDLGEDRPTDFAAAIDSTLSDLERLDEIPASAYRSIDPPATDRAAGYRSTDDEDPFNAWITKCEVQETMDGSLADVTVGLKDTINLAGIELTLGSSLLEGYRPAVDATVVTRLLAEGATILGKNNMTGTGADFGPTLNPTAPDYGIGGSSSGGAAAVAAGDVDVAIGGDQAGSIRIPASYAGLVGLKPTHGLVPYTGIAGYDPPIDHTGPITRTVATAARTLEAIAGRDGLDPRQPGDLAVEPYTDALVDDVSGLSVAVLREGFEQEVGEDAVSAVVEGAIGALDDLGVDGNEVSIPLFAYSTPIVFTVLFYGMGQMVKQNGYPTGLDGWYDTGFIDRFGRAREAGEDGFPPSVKTRLLLTEYLQRHDHGRRYAEARNAALELRREVDGILGEADAIVLPTSPVTPPPAGETGGIEPLKADGAVITSAVNSGVFNLTGHPAITVPCGTVEGAPVGLMLVGGRYDESTILRLAYAFEQRTDHGVAG